MFVHAHESQEPAIILTLTAAMTEMPDDDEPGETTYEFEDHSFDTINEAAQFIHDNLGHCELSSSFTCAQDITACEWLTACDSEVDVSNGAITRMSVTFDADLPDETVRAICCELAKMKLLYGGQKLLGGLRLVK